MWPKLKPNENEEVDKFIMRFSKYKKVEEFKNCNVHSETISSLIRFIGRSSSFEEIITNKYLLFIYIRFLKSACITSLVWKKILRKEKPHLVILNHGIYIPQGIILELAKKLNIKVRTFHLGYRKNSIITGDGNTYHKTLVETNIDEILQRPLNNYQKKVINSYLVSRRTGHNDQISFAHKNAENNNLPKRILRLENFTLILTNVSWDAQIFYKNNVYESMFEWIIDLISLAKSMPLHNFVFRCHPAEVNGRRISKTKCSDFINKNSRGLKNIYVISSEEPISTYKLIDKCSEVIVYSTKTAIETTCAGKPTLVCGESFIRGKGIGIDLNKKSNLKKDFLKLISNPEINTERALRYAYHYFFTETIEIPKNANEEKILINKFLNL